MKYNTDINIIGSIPDYHLIYSALPLLEKGDDLFNSLVVNNEYNFRTEKSRKRFLFSLNSAFITNNIELNNFIKILLEHFNGDEKSQALILFWNFSINNQLFFDITKDVFLKYYYQGRIELPKNDVEAYLKDLIHSNEELKGKWSKKTIETISSKYLTVLKKLHILEGSRKKLFCFVRVSDEMLAIFIHLYLCRNDRNHNLIEDDFSIFGFVSKEQLLERLKVIGRKDWIKMNYTGSIRRVENVFNSKNIINGLF